MRGLDIGGIQVNVTRAQRRLLASLAIVSVGCLLVGFLSGYIHGPAGEQGGHVVLSPLPLPHDIAVHRALPVLEAYQHWGHYSEDTDSGNDVSGDTDLSLSFSLVGVHQFELSGEQERYHRGQRMALLLYIEDGPIAAERLASVPDANDMIRIEEGQVLFDRVSVKDITVDSITLTGRLNSTSAATRKSSEASNITQTAMADESHTWRLSVYADAP